MHSRVYKSLNSMNHNDYMRTQYKLHDQIGHENYRRTAGYKPMLMGQFQRMQSNPDYLVHTLIGQKLYDGEKFDEVKDFYMVRLKDQKVLKEDKTNGNSLDLDIIL